MPAEQNKIWILIQEEKTNFVSVNHGRWGYSMFLKEIKGASFRVLSLCLIPHHFSSSSVMICGRIRLSKNWAIYLWQQKISKLLNLTFCVSEVEQVCMSWLAGDHMLQFGLQHSVSWLLLEKTEEQVFILCYQICIFYTHTYM